MGITKKKYLLIDAEIADQLNLLSLRQNNTNYIRIVSKHEDSDRLLEEIDSKKQETTHIICHGNENTLFIGTGISIQQLIEQEQNKQKHLVLWACNAGVQIEAYSAKTLRISENKLGRGSQ